MKRRFSFIFILIFILIFANACSTDEGGDIPSKQNEQVELTISAAASLKEVMEDIQKIYREEKPETSLRFNFGGSGSLKQQISQGAPVDLFFSAAEDKFDLLVEEGKIVEEDSIDLLSNNLVLIVPKDSPIKSFDDLAKKEVETISIGTPETVPAGNYAKESLQNLNLWQEIEGKIVYAKDVRQVLSYVETGNVEAGIVYKTDALTSEKVEIVAEADSTTHNPIIYPVGIMKDSKNYEEAKQFFKFLQNEQVLKVFEDYGFIAK